MKFLPKQRLCWNASLVSNVSDATQQKCDLLSRGNHLLFILLLGTINLSLRIRLGGGLFLYGQQCYVFMHHSSTGSKSWHTLRWVTSFLAGCKCTPFLLGVGEKNEPIFKKLSLRDSAFKMM